MISIVFSPRGIPASYRHQQGFGVNTYKWVNAAGETVLVKYHWIPKQGVKSLTAARTPPRSRARARLAHQGPLRRDRSRRLPGVGAEGPGHERRRPPRARLRPARRHQGLAEEQFPLNPIGRMVLDRAPENFFLENEQIAFGTGVLVDGLDFSDDKMLVGRTFSYSDTQRTGGPTPQLPVNRPGHTCTNHVTGDGLRVDPRRGEPARQLRASTGGCRRPSRRAGSRARYTAATRQRIPRTNDYQQVGEHYLLIEQWERDDMVANFIDALGQCDRHPGADGLAPAHVRGRARPAGRRGHRHQPTTSPRAAGHQTTEASWTGGQPGRTARTYGDHDPLRPQQARDRRPLVDHSLPRRGGSGLAVRRAALVAWQATHLGSSEPGCASGGLTPTRTDQQVSAHQL